MIPLRIESYDSKRNSSGKVSTKLILEAKKEYLLLVESYLQEKYTSGKDEFKKQKTQACDQTTKERIKAGRDPSDQRTKWKAKRKDQNRGTAPEEHSHQGQTIIQNSQPELRKTMANIKREITAKFRTNRGRSTRRRHDRSSRVRSDKAEMEEL